MKKKMRMVRRACPLCSSRDESHIFAPENFDPTTLDEFAFASRKMPEHMHYRLILCPRCDLAYSNPLPTLGHIAKNYHEAAYDSSEEAHFAARTYARSLPEIMRNIGEAKGALDIGTGDGAFLEELLEKGFSQVMGVEPSRAPIQSSLPRIKPLIRRGLFDPKHYKRGSLGLVTCFQTFEHLYDPMKMCRDAYGILRKGGAFFAIGHNRRALSAKLMGTKSPIFDIEHLQIFSPQSAKYMLEKAGFTQVEVRPIFNSYPLHYWLKLLPLSKETKVTLIELLKKAKIGYCPLILPAGNMSVIGYKR